MSHACGKHYNTMKKFILYLTYIAAALIGIMLLIFSQQAAAIGTPVAINALIIIIGVIFLIPGIGLLLASMRQKHDKEGHPVKRSWLIVLIAAIALIWGILSVSMTGILVKILPITLGITLIIAGIVQIIWMASTPKQYKQRAWWYIVPIVVISVGIICIVAVNAIDIVGKAAAIACIISGLALIIFAIGGFISLKRHPKEQPITKEVSENANNAENSNEDIKDSIEENNKKEEEVAEKGEN